MEQFVTKMIMIHLLKQTYYAHMKHSSVQEKEIQMTIAVCECLGCSHFVVSEFTVDNLYSLDVFTSYYYP